MKRNQRWNNLEICPCRNPNTDGSDLWSNTLSLDHGGALYVRMYVWMYVCILGVNIMIYLPIKQSFIQFIQPANHTINTSIDYDRLLLSEASIKISTLFLSINHLSHTNMGFSIPEFHNSNLRFIFLWALMRISIRTFYIRRRKYSLPRFHDLLKAFDITNRYILMNSLNIPCFVAFQLIS